MEQAILSALRKQRKRPLTLERLCDLVAQPPRLVRGAVAELQRQGWNVSIAEDGFQLKVIEAQAPRQPSITHDLAEYQGKWVKFGVAGDKHLCNMHSRLDCMALAYRLFKSEGIDTVYDTGNWIDGECRFNKGELLVHGLDAQIDYWIDNHPREEGITTYYVAGDDHEGWYQQRECIDIGRHAMLRAQEAGRSDLVYIGYAEALVELKVPGGSRIMMVNHPGGGASYAISYKGQKYVESLQGGEKPAIILQGHYHKANYGYPREVHTIDTGTMCDQTLFMRKKHLQAHVGCWIISLMQGHDGRIIRFSAEFLPFYDRGFYGAQRRRFGLPKGVKAAA